MNLLKVLGKLFGGEAKPADAAPVSSPSPSGGEGLFARAAPAAVTSAEPGRVAPGSPAAGASADDARVHPNIPVIDDAAGIPVYSQVLTVAGAKYQLVAADARVAALVRLTESRVALLWSNRRRDRAIHVLLQKRLSADGQEITDYYEVTDHVVAIVNSKPNGLQNENVEVSQATDGASSVKLAENIVAEAVRRRASDVHLEVDEFATIVRFRIDGELVPLGLPLTKDEGLAVARAYHAMAHNDSKSVAFSERDIQDARIERDIEVVPGQAKWRVTLRYAGGPVQGGADVVLRILVAGRSSTAHDLPGLGFTPEQIQVLHRMVRIPTGIILLMGVTGSGKTTSLKHLLSLYHERSGGRRKIITIEDPVELVIPGARQASVVRKEGSDNPFPKYLKSAMRRDPDVIMVSEIRDRETAMLAVEAAQTGHMVFSTIHATNWSVAIERMHEQWKMSLGLLGSPDLITGMVYQTLLSKLCPHCSIPFDIDAVEAGKDFYGVDEELAAEIATVTSGNYKSVRVANPLGCPKCNSGTFGRTVAAEIMMMDEQLAELISAGRSIDAKRWWRSGSSCGGRYRALGASALRHGLQRMMEGVVSPLELRDVFGSLEDDRGAEALESRPKLKVA